MFLHIGNGINILLKDVVAIMDKDSIEKSKGNMAYVKKLLENGNLGNENMDDIKTYIVTCPSNIHRKNRKYNKEYTIYTSNISSTTLFRRKEEIETRLEVE